MSIFDSPELQQVKSEAATAASNYSSASAAGISLPDMLREALTKKFSTSNPLIQQREGAVKNYMTESSAAPLAVTPKSAGGQADVVYTPQEQAALIGGRRAAAMAPVSSLNALLGLTQTGLENVIGATGRAYEGQVAGLKNEADLKRLAYTDLLTELSKKADEAYRANDLALKASNAGTSKLTASERTKAAFAKEVLKQVDTLNTKYPGFEGTGPWSGTVADLLKDIAPGMANRNLTQLQSDIGPLRESIVNLISGANVSAEEAKRVMSWIPDSKKASQTNKENLSSLLNWARTKYESITNESYDGGSTGSGEGDWELISQ